MSILFHCAGDTDDQLLQALQMLQPNTEIRKWPDTGDSSTITTAAIWQPPANFFNGLNNLKAILSISAGVDHLLQHPGLPPDIPIVRLCDAGMGEKMAGYVLYGVLHAHRQMPELAIAQKSRQWAADTPVCNAAMYPVGILGYGTLGKIVASRLQMNGYPVTAWSRTAKNTAGIKSYAGESQLSEFLCNLQVLICLLPLTATTTGILSSKMFTAMRRGAYLINPGRGDHLVEKDLLHALDSGQLSGALLDVFATEPLPEQSALWNHQRVLITPHLAAPTSALESAEQLAGTLKILALGGRPDGLVDRDLGY